MTPKEAAAFLAAHDRYLILTHVRPDGDTVGCAAGLCRTLRKLGKEAVVLPNRQATSLFTPYWEGLLAPEGYEPDTVVTVDIAARGLFPENALPYLERVNLAVDHHPSQEFFAENTCLDAGKAACAEIIYEIVKELVPVDQEIAVPLYMAIASDCGCFVYSNTNAACHRAAAELLETGFDVYPINRRHFRSKSLNRLRLESRLVSELELRDNGATAVVCLTLAIIRELGLREEDVEDVSGFVGQIEGVRTGVTLRELSPTECKLSLRTDPGDLNASHVCKLLGGGGHAAAAGATLPGCTMAEARERVLKAIETIRQQEG